ncbi:MAG TPA: vitamin K epoxide reductase family protein [Candidatus Limnocylindrales bacterium]|nr:vitamin K epoxide reductase family protein [Candidatus Limnocylindrales bacterium]
MAAAASLVGVGIAATISYVHAQIASMGATYESFCSVNSSINCDAVLSSSYARLAGIPVAWLALAAYVTMAVLFFMAARSSGARQQTHLRLATILVIGAVVFSAYMAVISAAVLQTVCLLCMGLYVVALALTALVLAASRQARRLGSQGLTAGAAGMTLAGAVVAVAFLALVTWPRATATAGIGSLEEARAADPDFYAWYTALPVVDVASLLREGHEAPKAGKVTIVDFSDMECGHCRKNFQTLVKLRERQPDVVELVHRHFPLDASCNEAVPASIHPNACKAAQAVECAGQQGKLEPMTQILFENQGQLFAENLVRLAGKIGLDLDKFRACLDSKQTLPAVIEDCRAGARLAITSTPTIFIQGRRVRGTLDDPKYDLAVAIEQHRDDTTASVQ